VRRAVFRLDSGKQFGLGHLVRSKALADALTKQGIECTFAVKTIHAINAIQPYHLILLGSEEAFILLAAEFDIIIIDHYDYNTALFKQLADYANAVVVVLDDECNRGPLYADIIVNPISQIEALPYSDAAPNAKLLTGVQYRLLRAAFSEVELPPFQQRQSVLISFGGSDVAGLTLPVLKQLQESELADYEIIVITGGGCAGYEEISRLCQKNNFQHLHDVADMAALFKTAKLAISAAGSTVFELACCGVPSVFALVADNQLLSVQEQQQAGWCQVVDCRHDNRAELLVKAAEKLSAAQALEAMSIKARQQIDGKGAERVAAIIQQFEKNL
jgi:UDP-2,4-diacetamido-2,4,6-trideoxy-beta-L-altropyranose hydrolase